MMLDRQFATHGHMFRLAVEEKASGWDVQERYDSTPCHTLNITTTGIASSERCGCSRWRRSVMVPLTSPHR